MTTKDNEIDEVMAELYEKKEYGGRKRFVGAAKWCPNGNWAGVTSAITASNDRSSYKTVFEWEGKYASGGNLSTKIEKEMAIINKKPHKRNTKMSFNKNLGILRVTKYHTGFGTKEYEKKLTERSVWISASTILDLYVKDYPEIQEFHYEAIWRDRPVLKIVTNKEELDTIDFDGIYDKYEDQYYKASNADDDFEVKNYA